MCLKKKTWDVKRRSPRLMKKDKKGFAASAGNRTRINCLEGSYADHYTTDAYIKLLEQIVFLALQYLPNDVLVTHRYQGFQIGGYSSVVEQSAAVR